MPRTLVCLPLLAALSLTGCSRTTVVSVPFTADLEVAPDEIRGGDGFRVRLTVTNRASQPYALSSPNGCVTTLVVRRGDVEVPLKGSVFGCPAQATAFEFAGNETRTFDFRIVAVVEGEDDGLPEPGAYEISATPHVNLPPMQRGFVIREPEPENEPEREGPGLQIP